MIHRLLLLIAGITLFFACSRKDKKTGTGTPAPAIDSFLVTDSTWGPITAHSTYADLLRLYGEANLKNVRECDLECQDSINVTKVYPGQKNEITIIWEDTAYHKKISLIESFNEQPDWHSAEGIKIGSGLPELLHANDSAISFYGFGWDYSGTISGYHGGKLEKSRIGYRMNLNQQSNVNDSLYGDVELNTRMPLVRNVMDSITISWIFLNLAQPREE